VITLDYDINCVEMGNVDGRNVYISGSKRCNISWIRLQWIFNDHNWRDHFKYYNL